MKKDKGNVYYTFHHADGTKENKIMSIKDVYILHKDRMDLMEHQFNKIISNMKQSIFAVFMIALSSGIA